MSDEREGAIRSVLNEAREQTADVADQVKSAAEDWPKTLSRMQCFPDCVMARAIMVQSELAVDQ